MMKMEEMGSLDSSLEGLEHLLGSGEMPGEGTNSSISWCKIESSKKKRDEDGGKQSDIRSGRDSCLVGWYLAWQLNDIQEGICEGSGFV